jgi:pimeloyl-ACP methyl ester carboxylesterase
LIGVEVVERDEIDEIIDGRERLAVVREMLRVPGGTLGPPLAVERTRKAVGGADRPPVLLIHGLAQNRYSWRVTGRSFSAYLAGRGFDVLNLELRGHGRSRAWGAGNARSFDEYIVDAERVIDRCARAPFVIGHSLGGAVGVGVAGRRALGGLVHLAGVYAFATRNRTLRALARLTLAAEPVLGLAPVRVHTGWTGELLARLYAITDIAGYGAPIAGWAPDSIERDLLAERLVAGFDWTSVEVWLQMARWARGETPSFAAAFALADVPLLVACGDADPLVHPDDARRCFDGSGSSDKQIVVFDRFDHQVHWGHVDLILGRKAPEVVWPVLADWMLQRC